MEKQQSQFALEKEITNWFQQVVAKRYVNYSVPNEHISKKNPRVVRQGSNEVGKIY